MLVSVRDLLYEEKTDEIDAIKMISPDTVECQDTPREKEREITRGCTPGKDGAI